MGIAEAVFGLSGEKKDTVYSGNRAWNFMAERGRKIPVG
jgi:hypothetical protein